MDPVTVRLLVVVALVLGVTLLGRVAAARRARVRIVARDDAATGSPRTVDAGERPDPDVDGARTSATGGSHGLLFGSPTCAPCESVKTLLEDVADERDDFTWTVLDAADHLDLARRHGVRTVPTLLLADRDGAVVARTTGVPSRSDLAAAVALAAGDEPREQDATAGSGLARSA